MSSAVAVNALKYSPLFRNTSVRLLADLVELAAKHRRRLDERGETADAAILVVLEGELHVHPHRGDGHAGKAAAPALLGQGDVYWGNGTPSLRDKHLRVHATKPDGAHVLGLPEQLLERAAGASFALAESLDRDLPGVRELLAHGPAAEAIWVSRAPGFDAPLEALTELLAASIARDFDEPTAILTIVEHGARLTRWERDRFVGVPFERPPDRVTERALVRALAGTPRGEAPPRHVFVVHPSVPDELPPAFDELRFHRIVYLTDAVPTEIPPALEHRLRPGARNPSEPSDAYFSAFIPAIVLRDRPRTGLGALLPRFRRPDVFETERLDDALLPGFEEPLVRPGWRLRRDQCRLRLDLAALARRWSRVNGRSPGRPFAAEALAADPDCRATVSRWGRAVTNRRVGLALSGGGASSYRMVPLIRALRARGADVPIDVVSAISGGALVGAYYCTDGLRGLRRCVARGRGYQLVVYGAIFDSRLIELVVDWDLGGTRLEDVEVRFVPLTTALPPTGPPEARAVVRGTLGEAVRASGGAPAAFAPTEKGGTRYTDGATATPVPARILKDYGADLVLAYNCVPGPERRNPFADSFIGELLYRYTPAGRLIDLWVAAAFLLQRISREVADDAHVFIEPAPQELPLVESFRFVRAAEIEAESADDPRLQAGVARCRRRWREFARIRHA